MTISETTSSPPKEHGNEVEKEEIGLEVEVDGVSDGLGNLKMESGTRKRKGVNPCEVCGHYHDYKGGEVCGTCGHRSSVGSSSAANKGSVDISAPPSEILPEFLYLGSHYNAATVAPDHALGISHVLHTVPCIDQSSVVHHWIKYDDTLQFEKAIQILEECEKNKVRILVHCMSGKSRSPAFVIAYLMKSKGWTLPQSYQWVKERRPVVELTEGVLKQLQEYQGRLIISSADNTKPDDGIQAKKTTHSSSPLKTVACKVRKTAPWRHSSSMKEAYATYPSLAERHAFENWKFYYSTRDLLMRLPAEMCPTPWPGGEGEDGSRVGREGVLTAEQKQVLERHGYPMNGTREEKLEAMARVEAMYDRRNANPSRTGRELLDTV